MSSLSRQEQLCQLIDEQQERIRQTFPICCLSTMDPRPRIIRLDAGYWGLPRKLEEP